MTATLFSLIDELHTKARLLKASMLDDLSRDVTTHYVADMRDYDDIQDGIAILEAKLSS